jgi:glycosyltransferase involved in cell wall biosynthesis
MSFLSRDCSFSIVIPVYNRAALAARAVRSCLDQEWDDVEIIVVDDGSTDDVQSQIAAVGGSRAHVIRQRENRGPGPARNVGADHATGDWIVLLDSDDELLPNALLRMSEKIRSLPEAVAGLRFMARLENGAMSPDPPLQEDTWDYPEYLRWSERVLHTRQDTLPCVRRSTFRVVRFPERHGGVEMLYHLDFAQQYLLATSSSVVLKINVDAPNQLSRFDHERTLSHAAGQAKYFEEILARHGQALRRHAPVLLASLTRGLATQRFLAADRRGGLRTLAELMRMAGPSVELFGILALGLAGPRSLAHVRAARTRLTSDT